MTSWLKEIPVYRSLKIGELGNVAIRPTSLDRPIQGDESLQFADVIGDEEADSPFRTPPPTRTCLRRSAHCSICSTTANARSSTHGLVSMGTEPETLGEVGVKFGVTRERVRQLQRVALD